MVLPTVQLRSEAGAASSSRRARFLATLAPLLGALLILTFATVSISNREDVRQLADSFLPSYFQHGQGRRVLYHPADYDKYLACGKVFDKCDDADGELTLNEFKCAVKLMIKKKIKKELPGSMNSVFSDIHKDFAGKTARNNQVVDFNGMTMGNLDEIDGADMRILEQFCNKTEDEVDKAILEYASTSGETLTEADGDVIDLEECDLDTRRYLLGVIPMGRRNLGGCPSKQERAAAGNQIAPQPVSINVSMVLSLVNITIQDLLDSLETGEDIGNIQHAFGAFANDIVALLSSYDNSTRVRHLRTGEEFGPLPGTLIGVDGEYLDHQGERRRRLNVGLANNSAQIYNYVESLCPGQTDETQGALAEAISAVGYLFNVTNSTNGQSGPTCVTALAKYQIVVDQAEVEKDGGLAGVYEKAEEATKAAIEEGVMEQKIDQEPGENMFHVEGVGTVEDDAFDPYEDVENDDDEDKGLRTVDIILISVGSVLIFCLCCVLCFVELERKTRPRPGVNN